jgi:hypothetical protein
MILLIRFCCVPDAYGLPEFGGHLYLYRLGILPVFIMAPRSGRHQLISVQILQRFGSVCRVRYIILMCVTSFSLVASGGFQPSRAARSTVCHWFSVILDGGGIPLGLVLKLKFPSGFSKIDGLISPWRGFKFSN